MHSRHSIPISEIKIENRQRLDYGDLTDLKESLSRYGVIQPIVLAQDNRLIAGGRRLESARQLGWETIDVVYRETLSEDELYILELEENLQRKDQTWAEKCLHIQTIHHTKQRLAAKDSQTWGQRETGELCGIYSKSSIYHSLAVAAELKKELGPDNKPIEGARFWSCDSLSDAWRLILRDEENQINAELAARSRAEAVPVEVFEEEQTLLAEFEEVNSEPDALAGERERYYSNPLNPPGSFEDYWQEKQAWANQVKNTIHISNKFHHGDSIKFMHEHPNMFDHVITDIPYAIDMAMLNQQNVHGGMADIDTVEELHDVEYNLKLIADFFPAAYHCTKPNAFVITWCDISGSQKQMEKVGCFTLWEYMMREALKAGFAVQRWPITWFKKSRCMNQCAGYNTTKDTEIAIVCRKKGATLVWQPDSSVIEAPRDELCSDLGHPFAKPFAIWERLIKMVSVEGHTILEPFMGRGSGVISMLRMSRNVYGCELDKDHFNAALENVKKHHYLKLNPNFQFK